MRKWIGRIAVAGAFAAASPGCDDGPDVTQLARLEQVASCEDVVRMARERAIREMEERVDQAMERRLRSCAWDDGWGDRLPSGGGEVLNVTEENGRQYDPTTGGGGGYSPPAGPTDHSSTNNQVTGVDEADIVKTDGEYIYLVADDRFQIIDSWPAAESRRIAAREIEGRPTRLLVHGDRAVVYSSLDPSPGAYFGYGSCSYGYDCEFVGDGFPTKITVFDVADRTRPTLVREIRFSGSYLASRRIEDAVYTVVYFPGIRLPMLSDWPAGHLHCDDLSGWVEVRRKFAALKEENRRILETYPLGEWRPEVTDTIHGPDGARATSIVGDACAGFQASRLADGDSILMVIGFDPQTVAPPRTAAIVGRPGAVYVSPTALYVASRHRFASQGWSWDDGGDVGDFTTVYRFDLRPEIPDAAYAASGVIPGRVLNQFSMDEHEGFLRLATTTGHLPDPDVQSALSVLERKGEDLVVVGSIGGIAPGEDIRAVRFDGDRGFVVTFKKTDPLFALDLADPRRPAIRGELQIPGFSTYMQPLDSTHLLTIGYDADDEGYFAWFQGIQLQIFDISDLARPQLRHREVIGTRGSTSDAATDHLAFNYYAPRELLALPMVVCEGGSGGSYGDTMSFSGLLVYRVTAEGGFEALGRVSHEDTASIAGVSCSNWWSRGDSQVKRSIFVEDFVYSFAPDALKVNRLDALGGDLVVIPLTAPSITSVALPPAVFAQPAGR